MNPSGTLTLRWMPGTNDRVRFEKGGRTFTVLLKDVHRLNIHSVNPLYLSGSVTLPVTPLHLSHLMGSLRQHVTARAAGTDVDAWVNEGGLAADEPRDGESRDTGNPA